MLGYYAVNAVMSRFAAAQAKKERNSMNRVVVFATLLVAIFTVFSAASADPVGAFGQMVVDRSTRSKVLNDYTLLTRDAIQRAWTIPLDLSVPHALKGKISINYVVSRDGSLESLEMVRGSGYPEMDRSLVRAIRAAAPFPPFPDEIAAQRIVIRANFVVADLPSVPVTRVTYPEGDEASGANSTGKAPNGNKVRWGVPAGAALKKDVPVDKKVSPAPSSPVQKDKMRWGHQQ